MNDFCQIPKLNKFTIEYSSKNISLQINDLKSQIEVSITFFSTSYIDCLNTDLSDDILNQKYNDGYKSIITHGYEHVEKINIMLEILQITACSKTDKFKYEKILKDFMDSGKLLDTFNELSIVLFNKNIEKCLDECEIKKNCFNLFYFNRKCKVREINIIHNEKKTFMLNERINVFNHHINQIILQLCKMKLVLESTQTN